eukprot:GEMP01009037.1.p1 GENE.GEMP01009037.1~~GEMP01009037.1.p1  ORF type:complete len:849 (+),score=203.46 GEMP01009037.1:133-2679(+)
MSRMALPRKSGRLLGQARPSRFQYLPSCPELRRTPRFKSDVGPREFFRQVRQRGHMWQNVLAWEEAFAGQVRETGHIPPQMLEELLRDLCEVCYEYTGGADADKVRQENQQLKEKLFKNCQMYLRELNQHREALRDTPNIGVGESYIYEPIQIMGEPWSSVMREVVDERVKQLRIKDIKFAQVGASSSDVMLLKDLLSQELLGHEETNRAYELAKQELEALKERAAELEAELAQNLCQIEEEKSEMDKLRQQLASMKVAERSDDTDAVTQGTLLEAEVEKLNILLELERQSRQEMERFMRESELEWQDERKKTAEAVEQMSRQLADAEILARSSEGTRDRDHAVRASAPIKSEDNISAEQKATQMAADLTAALRKLEEAERASQDAARASQEHSEKSDQNNRAWEDAQKKMLKQHAEEIQTYETRIRVLEEKTSQFMHIIDALKEKIAKLEKSTPEKKYSGIKINYDKNVTAFATGRVWTRLFQDAGCKTIRLDNLQQTEHLKQNDAILLRERSTYLSTKTSWTQLPKDRRTSLSPAGDDAVPRGRDTVQANARRHTHSPESLTSHSTRFDSPGSQSRHTISPRSFSRPPSSGTSRANRKSSRVVRRRSPNRRSAVLDDARATMDDGVGGVAPSGEGAENEADDVVGHDNICRTVSRLRALSHGAITTTRPPSRCGTTSRPLSRCSTASRPLSRGTASRPPSRGTASRPPSRGTASRGANSRPVSRCGPLSRPVSRRGVCTPAERWIPLDDFEGDDDDENPFAAFSHIPVEALEVDKDIAGEIQRPPQRTRSATPPSLPLVGAHARPPHLWPTNDPRREIASLAPDTADLDGQPLGVLLCRDKKSVAR